MDGKEEEERHGGDAVPAPPHPTRRRRPLPDQEPSAAAHQVPETVRRILASPSYREADEDPDFLQQPGTRGVRLQIEYLKVETLLREHNIAHTIVVFGGTRIREREPAERALKEAAQALAAEPENPLLKQHHAICQNLAATSKYYELAREFGRLVGRCGDRARDGRIIIMTGGGPGIMEAANRGAYEEGAHSAGLNITLPHEQFPNPYITPELCFRFRYFALRKLHFALRARALVVFPGGFGTMDELFEILALSQTRKMPPVPIILVGEDYWRRGFNPEFFVEQGVVDPEDRELFWFAETPQQIWQGILRWYEKKGEPLLMDQS